MRKLKRYMHSRLADTIILATTVICCYFVILFGMVLRKFFWEAYHMTSVKEFEYFMPRISSLAADHAWGFAVLIGVVGLATSCCFRFKPVRVLEILAMGLCGQALITWLALFCYCYNGFLGGISMHHGPNFELDSFIKCAFGLFPVTLVLILIPLSLAICQLFTPTPRTETIE